MLYMLNKSGRMVADMETQYAADYGALYDLGVEGEAFNKLNTSATLEDSLLDDAIAGEISADWRHVDDEAEAFRF